MAKDYYEIECCDGSKKQAIDIMREALGSWEFSAFCITTAFKYIVRKGRKMGEDIEKEENKIKDYIKWGFEANPKVAKMYIKSYKRISPLAEQFDKYLK